MTVPDIKFVHKSENDKEASKYNHKLVESKWQKVWEDKGIYSPEIKNPANPFYNLWMFPYPSAEGLHAGHAFASTGSDIYGRFKRMNGYDVFQPIGYDSFGIHSENYAIKIGETPQKMLSRTTDHYEKQLRSLGHGYDWTRTVTTSDPDYYKGTQWLFTEMFKAGLAYKKKAAVNFCPSCKTVLADEQVMSPQQAGKEPKDAKGNIITNNHELIADLRVCERCGTVVEKRELMQWFFRITDYAERLLEGLERIDWSERVKIAQKEWIGKKSGINITFNIKGYEDKITVFTTAPVNFGASFLVVSPEYAKKNLLKITPKELRPDIDSYIKVSLSKENQDRQNQGREKTGVYTGLDVVNHLTNKEIPVWVADFVLSDVGTGAVQGCPGHDKRDFQFAKKFDIPIPRVIVGDDEYDGPIETEDQVIEHGTSGKFINSGFINGLDFEDGLRQTMDYFESQGWGTRVTSYHLRDWLVSRQRYWGAPIPMIFCKNCEEKNVSWFDTEKYGKLAKIGNSDNRMAGWWPEENLPVILPEMKKYEPDGSGHGPLAHHPEFYEVKCPGCGSPARRETDVMDTFVDSSWYFLKYPSVGINSKTQDPNYKQIPNSNFENSKIENSLETGNRKLEIPWSPEVSKAWLPVNLYFGGAEHSVLHLMYARFMNMVMHDLGYIDHSEPFPKFFAHGLMIKDGAKMSKSRGNVVNPDEYVSKFGADTLRLYTMFLGPMDGYPDFRDTGIEGMSRFVNRVWRLFANPKKAVGVDLEDVCLKAHQTIKKVTREVSEFKYNTSIAALMEFVNVISEKGADNKILKVLAQLLAPFAPHLAEEVWQGILKQKGFIHLSKWPKYNEKYLKLDQTTVVIQVNGRIRGQFDLDTEVSTDKAKVEELAKNDRKVAKWLEGQIIKNVVFVPGRLINFVV